MKRKATLRGAAQDIARLHQNEWGVWHWKPEKKLRPQFKGQSLGKDPAAAMREAKRLNREVEAWTKGLPAAPAHRKPRRRSGPLTVSQLANLWRLGEDGQGSDHWRGLRERTQQQFRYALKVVEAEFGDDLAEAVTRSRVKNWLDPLKRRAPAGARSYCIVARVLFGWGMEGGHISLPANPFSKQKLSSGKHRPRYYSFADIKHLVAVADGRVNPPPNSYKGQDQWMPRPSIGTALVLAFACVQRITDVLALGEQDLVEKGGVTRLIFTQSKSQKKGRDFELEGGVRIDMKLPPLAAQRLKDAPPAEAPKLNWQPLVVNETTRRPFSDVLAAIRFAGVRKRAIAVDPERWGHLDGMQMRDCRRSGFIHLRKLGLTVEQIVNLSGHTLEAGYKIVEHYLPRTAEEADEVAALMTGEL
ncbi:hypothetical protein [Bosea minatitlanensis]|uniref:Tyr recombinase domain-containing protein n=1 Tax=Bosea minatitlanensis TaxID=128782 RepID=A0ABW0EZ87_9HYPH|nr:hypothetical protein [Bosea minatitlanensis]MCT4496037.1 hypothetical protein [Bosea minatitlanensis]